VKFQGVAYRALNPKWSWPPTSGEGARLHGGRFNPKGTAALYLSLASGTAVLEASQGFGRRFPPLTLVTYDIDCSDIADLTQKSALKKAKTTEGDLACSWMLHAALGQKVPTWALAKRLIAGGAAGIIVPSFAAGATPNDKNLVLWRWSDALPHRVSVFDPDQRLPRSQ
jgi:RES domain-containing protein